MTITIHFEAPEDLKFMEPLLLLMRQSGINPQLNFQKKANQKKPTGNITDRLHGILTLPNTFDYRAFLVEERLKDQRGNE